MENVVRLNNGIVWEDFSVYLRDLETQNTKVRYEKSLRLFFKWKYDKEIEWLTYDDINNLDYSTMKEFRAFMKEELNYASNTINNTMNSIYSALKEIRKMNPEAYYKLHVDDIRLKPLKVTDLESYGDISWETVDRMIDITKTFSEKKMGREKTALLLIARITGIRLAGLLSCSYSDLRKEYSDFYTLYYRIKGKQGCTALREEDAKMLLDLQKTKDNSEKIFKMSSKTVNRMMTELLEKLNIPSNSNISFHSIRRLAGQEVYASSGNNLILTQAFLDHSSPSVTRTYLQKKENLSASPSLYLGNENLDKGIDNITMGQFKHIYSELDRSTKWIIQNKMKELGYSDK